MDFKELQAEYYKNLRSVTEEKLVQGALIRTIVSSKEGLKFKDDRTEKPKRIIIIGIDKEEKLCYGTVLVNTKMNPRSDYSEEYLVAQYFLLQENYPEFLDYDSFVDCSTLFSIPLDKIKKGEYFGVLNDTDKFGVFNILESTDTITTHLKKRFNIRRR